MIKKEIRGIPFPECGFLHIFSRGRDPYLVTGEVVPAPPPNFFFVEARWLDSNPGDDFEKEVRARLTSEPARYTAYTREYLGGGVFALMAW